VTDPILSRDGIELRHGDALNELKLLVGQGIALVATDPPYGIGDKPIEAATTIDADGTKRHRCAAKGRGGSTVGGRVNTWHKPSPWDAELDPSWLPLALEVAPVVALFGHWRKRTAFEQAAGMEPRAEIIWAKDTHVGPQNVVAARDERIWIFSRAGVVPKRFDTSVWDEPIIPTFAHRWHKNEKPVALLKRLLLLLATPGDMILDPFCGSGSMLVAARDCGMRGIGVDADRDHLDNACRRLAQGVMFT